MGAPVRQTPSQPGTAAGGGGNQGGSSAVGATKMAADVVSACLQWWQRACTNRHGSRGQARVLPGWGGAAAAEPPAAAAGRWQQRLSHLQRQGCSAVQRSMMAMRALGAARSGDLALTRRLALSRHVWGPTCGAAGLRPGSSGGQGGAVHRHGLHLQGKTAISGD